MKRIFIMMIMAAIMVGCHKDDITPLQENDVAAYSGKLTLNVGEIDTKAFNGYEWNWEEGDVIYGYQNYGSKHLNQLRCTGENTFVCENFVYSTQELAKFCFFYGQVDADDLEITNLVEVRVTANQMQWFNDHNYGYWNFGNDYMLTHMIPIPGI